MVTGDSWDEWVTADRLMKTTEENIQKQKALDKKQGVDKNPKSGRSNQTKPKIYNGIPPFCQHIFLVGQKQSRHYFFSLFTMTNDCMLNKSMTFDGACELFSCSMTITEILCFRTIQISRWKRRMSRATVCPITMDNNIVKLNAYCSLANLINNA